MTVGSKICGSQNKCLCYDDDLPECSMDDFQRELLTVANFMVDSNNATHDTMSFHQICEPSFRFLLQLINELVRRYPSKTDFICRLETIDIV